MLDNIIRPQNNNFLKGLGVYQMAGGAIGLIFTFIAAFPFDNAFSNIIFVPCCLLFGLSIYSGWQTFKVTYHGLRLTIVNQLLQLFSLTIGKFGFNYIAGVGLSFTLDFTHTLNLGFSFEFSDIGIMINRGPNEYFFGLNLVALFLIYKVDKIMTQVKRDALLSKKGQHNA